MSISSLTIDQAPFLDPTDPDFSVRSEKVRRARDESWFAKTPYGLAILRYEEMREMILHPCLRQGSYKWPDHNRASGVWARWWKRIMLNVEGDDHARLRRLATPAFAPNLVRPLLPEFQRLAGGLIDKFVDRGRCEFMSEFAEPYAALVICSLVGAPNDHWRELVDMSADMGLALGVTYAQDEEKIDAATTRLFQFAENLVFERKRNPRDDFICALVNANENKDALSDQELYDMIVLSIFGGIDTTRNQLGLAMSMFIDHPDQWSLLAGNPDLARPAVEEVMRMRPTATWVTREATQDFNYKGIHISQGTTIHLFSESSATDPDHFEPGFDITADRQRHFGFGGGKHHCIGSPIARGDMSEALKLLAHELTGLNYDGDPVWLPDSGNTGPVTLPISFDKRQK